MSEKNISLAILGNPPRFPEPLHVGRPNMGNREALMARIGKILDTRWFSNAGPFVTEFEQRVAQFLGVKHCVSICNATVGLEIAIRAMDLKGEVIIPAYTFVATAHALRWQQITPVFCDMLPGSYNIDPSKIEALITAKTTGIIGVHLWGRPCEIEAIESIATRNSLRVLYDAAHAFGASHKGKMIGNFGACEVFSFHATKFLNSFEGGAVVTNDDDLAAKIKLMRNFGFAGYDKVVFLGTNGKMTEICAAMGLTSLDAIGELIEINARNFHQYENELKELPGVTLATYIDNERYNFQYIVVEVDPHVAPLNRDEIVAVLHAENILARKYFWPGCHKMEPYCSSDTNAALHLPVTEKVGARILVLPTGQSISSSEISDIARIIRASFQNADSIRQALRTLPNASSNA